MKKLIPTLIILGILIGGFFLFNTYIYTEKQTPTDFKEVGFFISGEPVQLSDGTAIATTSLGGDNPSIIKYFGNEVVHDVDGDGIEDTTFLITQETTAGKIYFYAVAALKRGEGYSGSHAVLIGEDISPQTTNAGEGREIVVNYANEAREGKSLYLLFDPETLSFGELIQNFEGEER